MMVAQKRSKNRTSNYHVFDMHRGGFGTVSNQMGLAWLRAVSQQADLRKKERLREIRPTMKVIAGSNSPNVHAPESLVVFISLGCA